MAKPKLPRNDDDDDAENTNRWPAYFTLWIKNLEKHLEERWETQKSNQALALESMNKRLDSLNELRAMVSDANNLMTPKVEFRQTVASIEKIIDTLEIQSSKSMTKEEHLTYQKTVDEAISLLRTAISNCLTKDEHIAYQKSVDAKLRPLEDYTMLLKSKASQSTVNLSIGIGLISLLIGLASIVLSIIRVVNGMP